MIGILTIAAKATLLIACALGIAALARSGRASVRHGVYAALFVTLLLLPVAPMVITGAAVEIPLAVTAPAAAAPTESQPVPVEAGRERVTVASTVSPATTPSNRSSFEWVLIARNIYFAGLTLLLATLAAGVWRLHRWQAEASLWLEGTTIATTIASSSAIRRAVLVAISEEVRVPMTFGFRKQTILMPAAAMEWSQEELQRAIRHELEHVRRDDWAMQIVARVACAVYWPHPMVWIALRRFFLEAERACDDAVVRGSDASMYANQLVSLARSIRRRSNVPALAMASPSRLSERVHAILDPKQVRGPQSRATLLLTASVMAALVVTIGSVRLVAASIEASDSASNDAISDGVTDGIPGSLEDAVRGQAISDGISEGLAGTLEDPELYRDAIVEAAERGDTRTLQFFFFERGININTPFIGDGTALLIASRAGQRNAVEWLLDNGADPNVPSPGDGNALIAVAGEGNAAMMTMLLDRGARVDDEVPGDENALITASGAGRLAAVKLLIARGANVNARIFADGREWRTPLNMARRGEFGDVVNVLIEAGARE